MKPSVRYRLITTRTQLTSASRDGIRVGTCKATIAAVVPSPLSSVLPDARIGRIFDERSEGGELMNSSNEFTSPIPALSGGENLGY